MSGRAYSTVIAVGMSLIGAYMSASHLSRTGLDLIKLDFHTEIAITGYDNTVILADKLAIIVLEVRLPASGTCCS